MFKPKKHVQWNYHNYLMFERSSILFKENFQQKRILNISNNIDEAAARQKRPLIWQISKSERIFQRIQCTDCLVYSSTEWSRSGHATTTATECCKGDEVRHRARVHFSWGKTDDDYLIYLCTRTTTRNMLTENSNFKCKQQQQRMKCS